MRNVLAVGLMLFSALSLAEAKTERFDARVRAVLETFQQQERAARELLDKASGVLVFPRVAKAGFGLGGEVGKGALLVDGETLEYYRTTGLSIGFQIGGQVRTEVILFLSDEALANFRNSNGWEAGVDGSIAIANFGVGRDIDTNSFQHPIIGFIFGNRGLMYDLSLDGSKYWRIDP